MLPQATLVKSPTPTPSSKVPYIAHTPEGRDDCLACHDLSVVWPAPADHKGRGNGICQTCHVPYPGGPPLAHSTAKNQDCDQCHGLEASDRIAILPESHGGPTPRTAEMCLICHEISEERPPVMAHVIKGREPCFQCHGPDVFVDLPASHAGRTQEMCRLCHEEKLALTPWTIAHSPKGKEKCSQCHGPEGLVDLPATHKGDTPRIDVMCQLCHDVVDKPPFAHSTAKGRQCDECHGLEGSGKTAVLPESHSGDTPRRAAMCLTCHEIIIGAEPAGHVLDEEEACTNCHGTGELVDLPDSHLGATPRTAQQCKLCHTQELTLPAVPHALNDELRKTCTPCHNNKVLSDLSETHLGASPRTEAMCKMCHKTADMPPAVPHKLEGRQQCDICHRYPAG